MTSKPTRVSGNSSFHPSKLPFSSRSRRDVFSFSNVTSGSHELKKDVGAVVLCDCRDATIKLPSKVTKLVISNVTNCEIHVNRIVTGICEIVRASSSTIHFESNVHTISIDISHNAKLQFNTKSEMETTVVACFCKNLELKREKHVQVFECVSSPIVPENENDQDGLENVEKETAVVGDDNSTTNKGSIMKPSSDALVKISQFLISWKSNQNVFGCEEAKRLNGKLVTKKDFEKALLIQKLIDQRVEEELAKMIKTQN